ncbi:anthranilate synthase component I family protein [Parvularcula oceani]|uniref:anthranilate synthase component I family protein n=1 Tax=Parvularcula oceani TaxID=1247963 RepID=UPI000689F67A|nr:anthranilate synthase component I family protein [Parvularcula oceani]
MAAEYQQQLLLGPGFAGTGLWSRPDGLIASETVSHAALGTPAGGVFDRLRRLAAALRPGQVVAGYLAYEAAKEVEPGLDLPAPPDGLPAAWFGLFSRLEAAAPPERIEGGMRPEAAILPGEAAPAYEEKVAEIVRRIRRGDIFQANLSRRSSARFPARDRLAETLFARLTAGGAADYAAFLSLPEGAILSASPELFLRVEGDRVAAEPIKGTRPRGRTENEDRALAAALLADEKDRAENVMIADLLRNDLSRVCRDGTMREEAVCALRTLPKVHHLYSRISATLREDAGAVDALRACFPCGSITGAPKLAAMRTIADLEGEGRGPYCGTIFALHGDGSAVFSVPIRTAVLTRGAEACRLDVRSGGGVTILSDPQAEWQETVDKAYPFALMTA